jgi:hypothetical protein
MNRSEHTNFLTRKSRFVHKLSKFFPIRKLTLAQKANVPKPRMPKSLGIAVAGVAIASLTLSGAMYWNYHLIDLQMSTPIVTIRLVLQK